MTIIYANSIDHYGPQAGTRVTTSSPQKVKWHIGSDVLLGDGWANTPETGAIASGGFFPTGLYSISKPAWGARSGDFALVADSADLGAITTEYFRQGGEAASLTIPGASLTTRLLHFAFGMSDLPPKLGQTGFIFNFSSIWGLRGTLGVTEEGRLILYDGGKLRQTQFGVTDIPNIMLISAAPVISANTWHFFSIKLTTNLTDTVDIQVYLGDILPENLVLTGTGLVMPSYTLEGTQWVASSLNSGGDIVSYGFLPASFTRIGNVGGEATKRAVRDIVLVDEAGAFNNDLLGQVFVSAQEMRAEAAGGGWQVNPRQNIDDGILDSITNRTGLRATDAASLELGAGDFTVESFIRFHTLQPEMDIFSKWRTNDNNRSYRLAYFGSDNTIRWQVSTDGINVTTIKVLPWTPQLDHWHHIAVTRAAGQTMLFIDGFQLGVPVADANTYFGSLAPLGIAARFDGTSTLVTTSVFDGWLDETRLTVGVARYTADFTPATTKFGRNATDDPSFASVALLLGYDSLSLADESSFGRVMATTAPAILAIIPDDGTDSFSVMNARPPIDDTYIEAPQTFAEGIFTFEAVPLVGETMTIGAQTYTWASPVGAANTVLVGTTISDSIDNIIAAVNGEPGEGTLYGTGTLPNTSAAASPFVSPQFLFRAVATGAAGNSVATTETMANGFFRDTTLTGGQDIPAPSAFAIERLPNDVTGVLAIQVTTRHSKTDAGSATVKTNLIGPAGAVAPGDPKSPDLNPSWARMIFEQDPDTAANITPSTLIRGRIQFERSA